MPQNRLLTLKLKHRKVTVLILVDCKGSLKSVRSELCTALNNSNILSFTANGDDDKDSIDIPKPSFEVDNDEKKTDEKTDKNSSGPIEPDQIRLAITDKEGTEFNELKDEEEQLLQLGVKDGSVIAFAIDGEEFEVDIPVDTYED